MPTGKGFSTTSEEMASACSSSLGGNLTKRTRRKFPRLACGGQSSYATLLHGQQDTQRTTTVLANSRCRTRSSHRS